MYIDVYIHILCTCVYVGTFVHTISCNAWILALQWFTNLKKKRMIMDSLYLQYMNWPELTFPFQKQNLEGNTSWRFDVVKYNLHHSLGSISASLAGFCCNHLNLGIKVIGFWCKAKNGTENRLVWGRQTWEWKSRIFRKYTYNHLHSVQYSMIQSSSDCSTYLPHVPSVW